MKNPFRFGQLVKGDNFCNRKKELSQIKRNIFNSYSQWIYSQRRYGKTSLILKVFEELKDTKTIYIDLYNVESLHSFAEKYSQITIKQLFDWKIGIKKIGEKISNYFMGINPKFYFDIKGEPSISFESQEIKNKIDIENILKIPEKIAAEKKWKVCVAFDEFQEINRINPFLINWMRSAFQTHQNISYAFLGSKQSLMNSIFADSNSPFYEFGLKIPINEISNKEWKIFIKKKFNLTKLNISEKTLKEILKKSRGHPHFTQYFSSVVWELIYEGADQSDPEFTTIWINHIISGQSIIFQNIFDQLSKNQRKLLIIIAKIKINEHLFSEKFRLKHQLPPTSSMVTAIKTLQKKDLILKTDNKYTINNPVMKEWLLNINK